MMRGQRGHDVLPFQLSADEVFGAIELDATIGIDLTDPGNQALGNRQRKAALTVEIGIESKTDRQVTESRSRRTPGKRVPCWSGLRLRQGLRK